MKDKRLLIPGLFVLLALAAFAFLPDAPKKEANGYGIGDTAIDFKLKNIDGATVSLSDYKDAKGFLVIFTSSLYISHASCNNIISYSNHAILAFFYFYDSKRSLLEYNNRDGKNPTVNNKISI